MLDDLRQVSIYAGPALRGAEGAAAPGPQDLRAPHQVHIRK